MVKLAFYCLRECNPRATNRDIPRSVVRMMFELPRYDSKHVLSADVIPAHTQAICEILIPVDPNSRNREIEEACGRCCPPCPCFLTSGSCILEPLVGIGISSSQAISVEAHVG